MENEIKEIKIAFIYNEPIKSMLFIFIVTFFLISSLKIEQDYLTTNEKLISITIYSLLASLSLIGLKKILTALNIIHWSFLCTFSTIIIINLFVLLSIKLLDQYVFMSFLIKLKSDHKSTISFQFVVSLIIIINIIFFWLMDLFINMKNKAITYEKHFHTSMTKEKKEKIEIKGENIGEKLICNEEDLIVLESLGNYVYLYVYNEKENILTKNIFRGSLKGFSNQLNDNFMKCHKSYIVNLNRIESAEGNLRQMELKLFMIQNPIPVARNYTKEMKNKLSNYD